jgi:hypothetical protein
MWECDICLLPEFKILSNFLVSERRDARHRVHRRSGGDQGDPRAPGGQSAPGARTAAATRPGAACAGLKRFTQRHQFKRIFP